MLPFYIKRSTLGCTLNFISLFSKTQVGGNASGGGSYVSGIGQGIFANIGFSVLGCACAKIGLSKTKNLDDLSNWPIWLGLAGLLTFATFGGKAIYLQHLPLAETSGGSQRIGRQDRADDRRDNRRPRQQHPRNHP